MITAAERPAPVVRSASAGLSVRLVMLSGMDLYAAMVTTAPFLLLALLAELKVFGPVGGATSPHQRREHRKTDQWIVVFLGVGFGAALFGLATGFDTGYLRFLTTVPLALGAFILGAAVLASIRAAHDGSDTA